VRRRHSDLPQFESVARISNLPIVESGIYIAGNVYRKIKVIKIILHVIKKSFVIKKLINLAFEDIRLCKTFLIEK